MSKRTLFDRTVKGNGNNGEDVCGNGNVVSAACGIVEDLDSPDYRFYEDRLKTYTNWPMYFHTRPESLSHSGFFYCGSSDKVQCYSCKGILKNWKDGDVPWIEHIKHFPQCQFVRQCVPSTVKEIHKVWRYSSEKKQQPFTLF